MDKQPELRYDVAYPERLSRLLIFVKWLLAFPHYIVLMVLGIAAFFAWIVAFFAVLVTGRWPAGLRDFMVGVTRWGYRVTAYVLLLTDRYPPFRLDMGGEEPVHGDDPAPAPTPSRRP